MRADHPITSSAGNDDSIDGHETTSSNWRKFNASSSLKKKESSTTSNNDAFVDETRLALPDDFLWDKESDISGYFKQLYEACNQNADRDDRFTHSCFGFMQSLIHEPRCTVNLDSRFRCSGDSTEIVQTIDAKSLIEEHFTSGTINIVVLGGGPVGLYFANAMMRLQRQQQGSGIASPMRILVIENRVHQEGYKKPYERDWTTGVCKKALKQAIDARILGFQDMLFEGNNYAIPLNTWETLLLLANRDRGVKFLYGNAKDYHAHLYQIPNLVVFDATGHRLNTLDRGEEGNNNDPTATTSISKWRPWSREMFRLAKSYWAFPFYQLRVELNEMVKVASRSSRKSGSLLYPVKDEKAYNINMIKILNLPQSPFMDLQMVRMAREANRKMPGFWAGPILPYRTEDYFRPDVKNRINKEYPGFPTGSVFINLTPEQGRAMESLMDQYSDKTRRGELPLSHVPMEVIASNPALQGEVGEVLLLAMRHDMAALGSNGEGSIVSWFHYRPYMYDDPVVPGGYDILGRQVPLLRIGDSLFSGDPTAGSGLESHMQSIRFLQCRLANLSGGSCEWKALEGGFEEEEDDDYVRYYEGGN